jgi:hypothetical protein
VTRRTVRPEFVHRLGRVLCVDAVGVAVLVCAAFAGTIGGARPERVRGLASTAAVGLVGLGLAATAVLAVGRVDRRGVGPHPDADPVAASRPARRLIVCGLALNTAGTVAVLGRYRRDRGAVAAALVLLVGGDVLSALYLRHLRSCATNVKPSA